jgi:hypothetical protein
MKLVKVHKPGTNKSQLVEADRVEFYRQYGYEPVVVEVKATVKPVKKTAKPEPAVEEVAEAAPSVEVVGDDNKGE